MTCDFQEKKIKLLEKFTQLFSINMSNDDKKSADYDCMFLKTTKAYDLNSERWRKPIYDEDSWFHQHLLDMEDLTSVTSFLSYDGFEFGSRISCVFCLADSTFDRTLEEILYHRYKSPCGKDWYKTLIEKWENNVDAWDNPIGNNIKG